MTYMLVDINAKNSSLKYYFHTNVKYVKTYMKSYRCLLFVVKLKIPISGWINGNKLKEYL